jgi:hypothetical protein
VSFLQTSPVQKYENYISPPWRAKKFLKLLGVSAWRRNFYQDAKMVCAKEDIAIACNLVYSNLEPEEAWAEAETILHQNILNYEFTRIETNKYRLQYRP